MSDKDFRVDGIISVANFFDNVSDDVIERALLRDELQAMCRHIGASQDIINGKQKPMVEAIRRYFKD